MCQPKYKRVVLKVSGEALAGPKGYGLDPIIVNSIAKQVATLMQLGIEMAIVVGGGNIWRGASGEHQGMERASSDYMGMLATVINSLALQDALEKHDVDTRVQTAIEMRSIAEPYIRRRAIRHLEKRRVVIFAAGNGNPYFSTDTTAALRTAEIEAEIMLKATKESGIFDDDPRKNPNAKQLERISYLDVLQKGLRVMDTTAISLCMDNHIPIIVFDLGVYGNIERVICGQSIGTYVGG